MIKLHFENQKHQKMKFFNALFLLNIVPSISSPTQCAYPSAKGCGIPTWKISYAMRNSLYTYCYETCPLAFLSQHKDLGVFGGVVGVDHYWTQQGMPCINGREFKQHYSKRK